MPVLEKAPLVENAFSAHQIDTLQIHRMPKPTEEDAFVSVAHARERAYEMIRLYRPALEALAK